MNFKPGQRVKKARGKSNIGFEGTVCGYVNSWEFGLLLRVKYEQPWQNHLGQVFDASEPALGYPEDYEPLDKPKGLSMTHEEVRELGAGLLSEIVKPGEIVEHGDVEESRV